MAPVRRSSRISEKTAQAKPPSYQELPNDSRKRRRKPALDSSPDQSLGEHIPTENSQPLSSQVTVPSFPNSFDETETKETESQSQEINVKAPRKKKPKPAQPPTYPPDMSRPYDTNRESLRIVTWNVASLRSVMRNGSFMSYLNREKPDMLCVQETKMTDEAMSEIDDFEGYDVHWNHSKRKGYSGVAVFVRKDLDRLGVSVSKVEHGCGEKVADTEGRVTTLYLSNEVALVNAYVPNSGGKLARLGYRTEEFEPAMRAYLNKLAEKWSVVYTGDLNVAHEVIDIHNSKGNQKSAGHTPEERTAFGEFLKSGVGWADSWRRRHPEFSGYTYYSRRFGDRLKRDGKGWRLDYFVIDEKSFQIGVVNDLFVRPEVEGSDHYPLVIDYKLP